MSRGYSRAALIAAGACLVLAPPLSAQSHFPTDAAIREIVRPFLVGNERGVVVGLLDADGSRRFVAVGNPDFDGRTIFEIGSITKVFTGLLLAEMVERGEVRLDEPVSALLPATVSVPTRSGRPITLVDLATHTSGFPREAAEFAPARPGHRYADFSAERLYDYLRTHELRRDPGTEAEYSNLGMGLLGHALALRAQIPFEALLRARILDPLGLTSTAITLNGAQQSRLAPGFSLDMDVLAGAGALRSSADDLLTLLAANLEPPDSLLGRAIRRSHQPHFRTGRNNQIGLNWQLGRTFGDPFVMHTGETYAYHGFTGFNPERRVGVVMLTNAPIQLRPIAMHLLSPHAPLITSGYRRTLMFLVVVVGWLFVYGVEAAWKRSGQSRRGATVARVLAALVTFGWIMGVYQISFVTSPAPPLPLSQRLLLVAGPLAVCLVAALSRSGARLALLPLPALIGFHSFRLGLDVLLHQTHVHSVLPMPFLSLWYLESVFGLVTVGLAVTATTHRINNVVLHVWNGIGALLLLNLIAIAWLNPWATQTPLIWLPAVLVPLALLGHIVVLRALGNVARPGSQGRAPRA